MKFSKSSLVFVFLLLLSIVLTSVTPVSGATQDRVRVWVTYQSGRKAEVFQALNLVNASLHYDFPELDAYVVSLPAAALNGILRNPFVVGVEGDPERILVQPMKSNLEAILQTGNPYTEQVVPWGIDAVQAPAVWVDEVRGPVTGEGRKVCIIDTGYYADHDDLPHDVTGMSQVDDNYLQDGVGHGTHVAGTIGALDNTVGVIGVSPGAVDYHIVKIFNDDGSWVSRSSDLTAAIFSCRDYGANVISMSLSGSRPNKQEERAFNQLYDAGILHVAAAGNHQEETAGALHYPASYASVISVAAIDSNLDVASFSAQNAPVELAAPGVGVLSTVPFIDKTTITVDGQTYNGYLIDFAPCIIATGVLADGGRCLTTGDWSGKVVLCERGDISFYDKTLNVQTSGGVAAVIYNNVPGEFFGTLGSALNIISISLSQEIGQYIISSKIGETATVESTFTPFASGYEAWDGTSMATPHVAGVAALIWSDNPAWTNAEIRAAMTATARDLGAPGRDIAYGYGLVQAAAALSNLRGEEPPPPPPPPPPPEEGQLVLQIISPISGQVIPASKADVEIKISVTADGGAIQGAVLLITLSGPKSAPVTLSGTTDAAGLFVTTYSINTRRMGTGTYTLEITASKDNYISDTEAVTFQVQ